MTDRELLVAAAKAAGIEHGADRLDCGLSLTRPDGRHGSLPQWNPLTDDGDALRLAVRLRLEVDIHHTGIAVRTPNGCKVLVDAEAEPDSYAATRRAITRAAAAIAEPKQEG